ncbi:hypothetical protein cypCar_00005406, partial [Cyprinus carpio]
LLGVHYIHQRRILHRDLKAKNIFLRKNIVKIGDFGVSCLLIGSCDLATTFTGTPYYMSPEALSHRAYDSKSDICYSQNTTFYEASENSINRFSSLLLFFSLQSMKHRFFSLTLRDKSMRGERDASQILRAL